MVGLYLYAYEVTCLSGGTSPVQGSLSWNSWLAYFSVQAPQQNVLLLLVRAKNPKPHTPARRRRKVLNIDGGKVRNIGGPRGGGGGGANFSLAVNGSETPSPISAK